MSPDRWLPPPIRDLPALTGPVDGHRLTADGCDVLFARGAAGVALPAHDHHTENWTVIVSGEVVVGKGGEEGSYRAGAWYHTAPGEKHTVRFPVDTVQIELRFAVPTA